MTVRCVPAAVMTNPYLTAANVNPSQALRAGHHAAARGATGGGVSAEAAGPNVSAIYANDHLCRIAAACS